MTRKRIEAGSADNGRRVAVYVRVSTTEQAQSGVGLATQENALREYAERNWPRAQVDVYKEEGVSAFSKSLGERPKGARLLAAINSGNVLAVLAYEQDRIERGGEVAWYAFAAACHNASTEIHTLQGRINDDVSGRLLQAFRSILDNDESRKKSHRTREAIATIAGRGLWRGGKPPWGYEVSEDKVLRPSSDAHLITEAFRRFDEGASQADVRRFLAGAAKVERDVVTLDNVRRILTNAVYAGYITTHTKTGAPRLIEGQHEPLCPKDRFARVQDRLSAKRETGHRESGLTKLGALGRCGGCGELLRVKSETKGGYTYYTCNAGCKRVRAIPTEHLEAVLLAYLIATRMWIEQALATEEWRVVVASDDDREETIRKMEGLKRARTTLLELVDDGTLSSAEARPRLQRNELRTRTLQPDYDRAVTKASNARGELEQLHDDLALGDDCGAAHFWRTADAKAKKAALARVLTRVELDKDEIRLTFRRAITRPVALGIQRGRRETEKTPVYHALGFGTPADSARPGGRSADSPRPAAKRTTPGTQPGRKSRSGSRARSAGRNQTLPSATAPERG